MGPLNLILINLIFEVLGITAVSRKVKVDPVPPPTTPGHFQTMRSQQTQQGQLG